MKIETKIVEELPDLQEALAYKIVSADRISTSRRGYDGIRIVAENLEDHDEAATMLWLSDAVGSKTKLGCFVDTFGFDTESWVGKTFMVMVWRQGNRQIEAYVEQGDAPKVLRKKKKE